MPKATKEQLLGKATVLDYDIFQGKLEEFMQLFEESEAKHTFATFIINHLL